MSYLDRLRNFKNTQGKEPTKLTQPCFVGFVGSPSGDISKKKGAFEPPPSPPVALDAILTEACVGVPGIDPTTLQSLLSAEDVVDILAGDIPVVPTLRAYAESFANGIRTGRIRVLAPVIPKAMLTSRVRCTDCVHFDLDIIGDGAGIGCCKIGGEGTGLGQPALWAHAERECRDFTSRSGGHDAL